MEVHEACGLFPMMADDEYRALMEDIRANGLREPLLVDKHGVLLDGRNRLRACEELGITPQTRTWTGTGVVDLVVSLNLHRRHLTESQKAALAVDLLPWYESEAKKRQAELNRPAAELTETFPEAARGEARSRVGRLLGVNPHYVSEAKQLAAESPARLEELRDGKITLYDVRKERKAKTRRANSETRAVDLGALARDTRAYPVIYADPPWPYDFAVDSGDTIEAHYATLPLEDIRRMPVADLRTPDALLFLWATSPKLAEAMQVVNAWGFTYRTCMVWDKGSIGPGYYARQQHELLLIATHGEPPTPLPENRPASVIHAPRTRHSEKPTQFYEIIERMYPDLPKLELFARQRRDGWVSWGDQCEE